ncbi:MAG: beta/gamma crystallin-related protein [Sphingobium sp.]
MRGISLTALSLLLSTPAVAQTAAPSMTLFELPGFLGRSVTITADTPDLAAEGFAKRAQSARVTGSWQVCPAVTFAGACQTLNGNMPILKKSQVVSVRPTPSSAASATPAAGSQSGTTPAAAALDLDALDVGAGTEGQDVFFYARPSLSGSELTAGTNDMAAATAFCKLAGQSTASSAGRTRVQASNLIDLASKTKVRGFALRDVVCRR